MPGIPQVFLLRPATMFMPYRKHKSYVAYAIQRPLYRSTFAFCLPYHRQFIPNPPCTLCVVRFLLHSNHRTYLLPTGISVGYLFSTGISVGHATPKMVR